MNYYILFMLLFISQFLTGQTLVSYEVIGEMTTEEAESELDITGAIYPQRYYKVIYMTEHQGGEVRQASGFVSIPTPKDNIYPMMVYQHGTAISREDVPSRDVETYLGKVMASYGYITVLPDYIGLGDSQGTHLYINADTESSAAADLILAAREIAIAEAVTFNNQLFITGYSQGGHASAALQRDIEQGRYPEITEVTAASHLSAPYSVSDKMIEFTLTDRPYNAVSYFPWVLLSLKSAYPQLLDSISIEDVFKPNFVEPVYQFESEQINLFELNLTLIGRILATGSHQILPKIMIQDDFLNAIIGNPSHAINIGLRLNDLHDWAPQAPTRLMGCAGDDQVWYENTIFAEEHMIQNGAPDLIAEEYGPDFDHGECVEPVFIATIEFFEQYQEIGKITNTIDFEYICQPYITQSNTQIRISVNERCNNIYTKQILSSNGKQIHLSDIHNSTIDIDHLGCGVYILQLIHEDGSSYSHKFIK